ncbi:MAG: hypothetical protein K6U80_12680 [Firmicutes bacterium]|nr:hypothetical protein [Bacillota bacterium]
MPSVTIDAGVLATPSPGASRDDIYHYIENLLDWQKLLEESWISIYMSEKISNTLVDDGAYPLRENLKRLFSSKGIIEYDVETLVYFIEYLLRLTPSFEKYCHIKDVLTEELLIEPNINILTPGKNMQSDLERCLVLFAILCNFSDNNPLNNHTWIIRECPSTGSIKLKAKIILLEHNRNDLQRLPQLPVMIEGPIPVCRDFRGLILKIEESSAWRAAQNEVEKEMALKVAIFKARFIGDTEAEWGSFPAFRFGRKFLESVDRICQSTPDNFLTKLLRSMAETLDKQNMRAVHPLREDEGGNTPQRIRKADSARAWRRDIDYNYHLHYWDCADGSIEFALIGPHNCFDIPD